MAGIGAKVFSCAKRTTGPILPATSILCLIQRGETIGGRGAYLRKLAGLADAEMYSLKSVAHLARRATPVHAIESGISPGIRQKGRRAGLL